MSLGELSVLRYDQSVSLAEMLNAWCQSASEETLDSTRLKISHYTHPFPYRIALFDDVLSKVRQINHLCERNNVQMTFTMRTHRDEEARLLDFVA